MSHVLITQIGKPNMQDNGEYKLTTYQLHDQQFESAMISFGLAEFLKPDRVLLLGTTGSAWSGLISMHPELMDSEEALTFHEILDHAQTAEAVRDEDLQQLGKLLTNELGCQVICQITPYLKKDAVKESAQYMQILAGYVEKGDSITLDITHGLRHHPMLAMIAALYLRTTLSVQINGIYYGMFDPKNDITPVLSLEGMLNLIDWVTALNSFDKDGDYSIFAKLMHEDGVDSSLSGSIEKAGFYERSSNSTQAREQLSLLQQHEFSQEDTPLTYLFSDALDERIEWSAERTRGDREIQLAKLYLKRRDYLRASIYALEGTISRGLDREKTNLNDYDFRDIYSKEDARPQSFRELKQLRNALAHGVAGTRGKSAKLLKDEAKLKEKLASLINKLNKSH